MSTKKRYLVDIRIFNPYGKLVNNFIMNPGHPIETAADEAVEAVIKEQLLFYGQDYYAESVAWKDVGKDGEPVQNAPCFVMGYSDWVGGWFYSNDKEE
jgi:hypothetical protein